MSEYNAEDIIAHSMKNPKVIEFTKYFETQITEAARKESAQLTMDIEKWYELLSEWAEELDFELSYKVKIMFAKHLAEWQAAQQGVQPTPRRRGDSARRRVRKSKSVLPAKSG